jgi:hypothetical protein
MSALTSSLRNSLIPTGAADALDGEELSEGTPDTLYAAFGLAHAGLSVPAWGLAIRGIFGLRPSACCREVNACGAKLGGARVPDVEAVGDVGSDGTEGCPPAAGTYGGVCSGAWYDAVARAGRLCISMGMREPWLRVAGLEGAGMAWDAGAFGMPEPDAPCDGICVGMACPLPYEPLC